MKGETLLTLVSINPLVFREDGSWLIIDGTGAYANEKGEGDFHKIINVPLGQVTITLTGSVQ